MPLLRTTFIERYFEWALLAVAAIFLLLMVAHYGVRSPNRVEYDGRQVGIIDLSNAIQRDAQALQVCIDNADVRDSRVPPFHQVLRGDHTAGIFGERTGLLSAVPTSLPRAVSFGARIPDITPVDPDRDVALVAPLPPARPVLTAGRSVVSCTNASPLGDGLAPGAEPAVRPVTWVSLGTCVDVAAQRAALLAAGYARLRAGVHITGVQLQRQERLATGDYGAWHDVAPDDALRPPGVPDPVPDLHTGVTVNQAALDNAFERLRQSPELHARPPFPAVDAGDAWQPPQPVMDAAQPVVVWAHDDSAEPGRTYRYRARVGLWNRYVGRPELLRDPARAHDSVILGRWSEASDPITIEKDTHFFVGSGRPKQRVATVEVWKWHAGRWLARRFKVGVGDTIGGARTVRHDATESRVDFSTGAVVLDVRCDEPAVRRLPSAGERPFTYLPAKTTKVVYVDPVSGDVQERSAARDRSAPLRRRLRRP